MPTALLLAGPGSGQKDKRADANAPAWPCYRALLDHCRAPLMLAIMVHVGFVVHQVSVGRAPALPYF